MTQPHYPTYNSEDVKCWLATVFGKDIFFESQLSRRFFKPESEMGSGAWQISYTGEIYLSIDLPPLVTAHFVQELRRNIAWAIGDNKRSEAKAAEATGTETTFPGWPSDQEIIRDNLTIDTAKLQILAERIKQPAGYTISTVHKMLAHEAAWIERKKSLASVANEIFLGIKPDNENPRFGFTYDTPRGNSEAVELQLKLSDYGSPFGEESWQIRHDWVNRNHDLGLDGMLAYDELHIGGMGSIDEYRLALDGISDIDITNKLEVLRRPDKLPIIRKYIHEVIAATLTKNWFDGTNHPDYRHDLQILWADLNGIVTDAASEERGRRREQLEQTPKHQEWAAIFPQLMKDYPVFGDFVRAVHGAAPEGHEAVYARLQQWTADHFPLLRQHLEKSPVPTPSRPDALLLPPRMVSWARPN